MENVPVTALDAPLWCCKCDIRIDHNSVDSLDDPYPFLKDGWKCVVSWGPDAHAMKWLCPSCAAQLDKLEAENAELHDRLDRIVKIGNMMCKSLADAESPAAGAGE